MSDSLPSSSVEEIREILLRYGVRQSVEELARSLAAYCASKVESRAAETGPPSVVDPVSTLTLPPALPDDYIPFHGRSAKYGKKISASAFLEQEQPWRLYRNERLLYAEHIRLLDDSLYHALRYQARAEKLSFAEYAKKMKIITKEELLAAPDKEMERQIFLLRRLRSMVMGKSMTEGYARSGHTDRSC